MNRWTNWHTPKIRRSNTAQKHCFVNNVFVHFALHWPDKGGRLQPHSHVTLLCQEPSFIDYLKIQFLFLSLQPTLGCTSLWKAFISHELKNLSSSVSKWGSYKCSLPESTQSPRTRENLPQGMNKWKSLQGSLHPSHAARIPALWHWLPCPPACPVARELFENTMQPHSLSHRGHFKDICWMTGWMSGQMNKLAFCPGPSQIRRRKTQYSSPAQEMLFS